MSRFSGKCDLYDHMSGLGGWFDKDGNPVKFGDEGVYVYYSDEYKDFIEFKRRTGGIIHQHKALTITPWNHDEAVKLCPELEILEHKKIVPDKRQKSGQREDVYYTYKYWGKEYTLKELNKRKVYITIDIHFDTLLDLIPYYPYIVSMSCSNDGKQTVYISSQSYVDEQLEGHLKGGWYSDFWQHYKKDLQDHYREIVLEYFNPKGYEHIERVTFKEENGKYIGQVQFPIDFNFDIEWRWEDNKIHNHWTSPKVIDYEKGLIEMSKQDYESYLGPTMSIYYVATRSRDIKPC